MRGAFYKQPLFSIDTKQEVKGLLAATYKHKSNPVIAILSLVISLNEQKDLNVNCINKKEHTLIPFTD